jgi:hypothetical protein
MEYRVNRLTQPPALSADWADPIWQAAEIIRIEQFRPESSDHRPLTEARLLYSDAGIHGIFRAHDRYVRCVHTQFQDLVCKDSCVEVYFQPKAGQAENNGYLNLEMSGNGTLLSYYISDAERAPGGFKAFVKLTPEQGRQVAIRSTLPAVVEPELSDPTEWCLQFFLPFTLLEAYVGPLGALPGQTWRCNLFKCADETSHPHWASWRPVKELNFHAPETFGTIRFV